MAEEKEFPETRTVTLTVTKRRLTEEEKKKYERRLKIKKVLNFFRRIVGLQTLDNPGGDCGPWYFKIMGGHTYSCRICWYGYPTAWPEEQCIQLPD